MPDAFKSIFIEISGVCNGKCPYCLNGRYKTSVGTFIEVDVFEKILQKLIEQGAINWRTVVGLYNWGEPFLHPQLPVIIRIANKYKISYSFSTNASVIPKIDANFVQGLDKITFSMPGFSQGSYDRIHKFNFEKICKNIEQIVNESRSAGFNGIFQISYHIYQFNLGEIPACKTFARENGIEFVPQFAILNHWYYLWLYISDTISYERLKEISQNLFCYPLNNLVTDSVGSYRCPQYDLLVIDENANVQLCCQVPKDTQYYAGNLLQEPINTILPRRESNRTCTYCIEKGVARYINTSLPVPAMFQEGRLTNFTQTLNKLHQVIKRGVRDL